MPSDVLAVDGSETAAAAASVLAAEVMRPLVVDDGSADVKLEGSNGEAAIVAEEPAGCERRSNLRDAALKALWPRANEARVCMVSRVLTTWLVLIPMHREDWSIWDEN